MKKLTSNEFMEKSKIIHKNKYDYSETKYLRNRDEVKIICPIHGSFEQTAKNHLKGWGCWLCSYKKRGDAKTLTKEQFIDRSNKIHDFKYNYSNVKYILASEKVEIICRKHGSFFQSPNHHMRNQGCVLCGRESIAKKNTLSTKDFIEESNRVHNFRYCYDNVEYTHNKAKVNIICIKHGSFDQTPNRHMSGDGCPKCSSSKGELLISNILDQLEVEYTTEYSFTDCSYKSILRYDFSIFIDNRLFLIEFQCIQHYEQVNWTKDYNRNLQIFNDTQLRDQIKRNYCIKNNISLLEIPYLETDIKYQICKFLFYEVSNEDY